MTERLTDEALADAIAVIGNCGFAEQRHADAAAVLIAYARRAAPADDLRDRIARIVTLDHLRLLQDPFMDCDLYRLDPECAESARVTADAIIAALSGTQEET